MLFDSYIREEVETDEVDRLVNKDPETAEGLENIADEVEQNMQASALESMTYFENGEEAQKHFTESADVQAMLEARKMSKRTIVRIGKNDDLKRRQNLASLILAREHNDPLFKKLALNRVQERKIRNAIYKKYGQRAKKVAVTSQKKHVIAMKKMPSLPTIKF